MSFDPDTSNPWVAKAVELRDIFARDAVERDQLGGRPVEQIRLLKESGLLSIVIPKEFGGAGEPYSTALKIGREFAKVDGSIGHIYGYHFSALIAARLNSDEPRSADLLRRSAAGDWFWGNTGNSFSKTLFGRKDGEWTIVSGFKPFASGSHVADYLSTSWEDELSGERKFAAIPADREGITILDDWDGIGQTQTGSGKVAYKDVRIHDNELVRGWVDASLPIRTIGPLQQQSVLLNVFIGTAQGALLAARDYTLNSSRPWMYSGVERHIDDPWIKRQYGELWVKTRAATVLADRAAAAIDHAIARGKALTEQERGEAAVAVAAANVLAGNVALEVTTEIFEVMGARSAVRKYGFDRFWRNARIHTLHNPAEYKARTVGTWYLTGAYPEPGVFR
ncbi:acyl-CoA dehydrogenase family protein [Mesorhizobium sp. M0016]|uniref:acyl-CoA dehydrogenase family protein n=1 Tax=Mesorhizobium sp. M0016 TaxID=2956843 RepID=UPI00333C00A9